MRCEWYGCWECVEADNRYIGRGFHITICSQPARLTPNILKCALKFRLTQLRHVAKKWNKVHEAKLSVWLIFVLWNPRHIEVQNTSWNSSNLQGLQERPCTDGHCLIDSIYVWYPWHYCPHCKTHIENHYNLTQDLGGHKTPSPSEDTQRWCCGLILPAKKWSRLGLVLSAVLANMGTQMTHFIKLAPGQVYPLKTTRQSKKKFAVPDFSDSYTLTWRYDRCLASTGRGVVWLGNIRWCWESGWLRAHDKVVRIIITTNRPLQPWLGAWGPASIQPMRGEPGPGKARAALWLVELTRPLPDSGSAKGPGLGSREGNGERENVWVGNGKNGENGAENIRRGEKASELM